MPYIYLSTGWQTSGTEIPFEDATAPSNVCRWVNKDVLPDIQAAVEPKFAATQGLFVPTTSADWLNQGSTMMGPPADYFGGAYDATLPARPDNRRYAFDYKSPATVRKSRLKELRERGEILVGDRYVYDISVETSAGILIPASADTDLLIPRRQNGTFPVSPRVRCWHRYYPSGILFPIAAPGVTQDSGSYGITPLNNVRQKVTRYTVPVDAKWRSPTLEEVVAFVSNIESAVTASEQSVGLVTRAVADANQQGLDILTNLGEGPETIRFIHGVLKQIISLTDLHIKNMREAKREFYRSMQKLGRAVVNPKALLDKLASLWLQWRYAVMPLVYTAEDALAALSAIPKVFDSVRKRQDFELQLDAPPGYQVRVEGDVRHRCFLKRRYNLALDGAEWRQIIVADVPTTLWELTKLSFVVDWALNVGDYLASLDSPPGVDREASLYSRQFLGNVVMTKLGCPGWEMRATVRLYKADILHNPRASSGLDLHLRMTWKRELDAIALAWSLFRGARKRA